MNGPTAAIFTKTLQEQNLRSPNNGDGSARYAITFKRSTDMFFDGIEVGIGYLSKCGYAREHEKQNRCQACDVCVKKNARKDTE